MCRARRADGPPEGHRAIGTAVDLQAVLSDAAGAGEQHVVVRQPCRFDRVGLQQRHVDVGQFADDRRRLRALDRDQCPVAGRVPDRGGVAVDPVTQAGEHDQGVGGVGNDEVSLLGQAVDEEVVEY